MFTNWFNMLWMLEGFMANCSSVQLFTNQNLRQKIFIMKASYSIITLLSCIYLCYLPMTTVDAAIVIAITEIMYNLPPSSEEFPTELEWIEIRNLGSDPLSFENVSVTEPVQMSLSDAGIMETGDRIVVSNDPTQFKDRYGIAPSITKPWNGTLPNIASRIVLTRFLGKNRLPYKLVEVSYGTEAPWCVLANGMGFSLTPISGMPTGTTKDELAFDAEFAFRWRASSKKYGTPLEGDSPSDYEALKIPQVYINEIYPHTDAPDVDQVELYNPSNEEVPLSGWSLTDNALFSPRLFVFDASYKISAKGYIIISEASLGFGLSSFGEEIYLFAFNLTSNDFMPYVDSAAFPASMNSRSLGRYVNSLGEAVWLHTTKTCEERLTCGLTAKEPNTWPVIGPIIIKRILYRGKNLNVKGDEEKRDEYVQIQNVGSETVYFSDYGTRSPSAICNCFYVSGAVFNVSTVPALLPQVLPDYDLTKVLSTNSFESLLTSTNQSSTFLFIQLNGTSELADAKALVKSPFKIEVDVSYHNGWRLRGGADYDFALTTSMAPNTQIRIVHDTPSEYKSRHEVPDDVTVVGPFKGTLSNKADVVELKSPDFQNEDGTVPYLRIDYVHYADNVPWPEQKKGQAIERVTHEGPFGLGNEPLNWRLANDAPLCAVNRSALAMALLSLLLQWR